MASSVAPKDKGWKRFLDAHSMAKTLQGRVYSARDKLTGNTVVVKEAFKHLVRRGRSRQGHSVDESFLDETRLHSDLSDCRDATLIGGIPLFLDSWESADSYFMAMERCEGRELFEYTVQLHKAGMSPEERVAWQRRVQCFFRDIVRTVAWMHANKITHNDLSLENVMLSSTDPESMRALLIDFGLGQKFDESQDLPWLKLARVGKDSYIAPEVYAFGQRYDCRAADRWSLGTMLFALLVGTHLYSRADPRREPRLEYALDGRLDEVLTRSKSTDKVPPLALDLLSKIFRYEADRISMEDLLRHPYVALGSLAEIRAEAPAAEGSEGLEQAPVEKSNSQEGVDGTVDESHKDESRVNAEAIEKEVDGADCDGSAVLEESPAVRRPSARLYLLAQKVMRRLADLEVENRGEGQ